MCNDILKFLLLKTAAHGHWCTFQFSSVQFSSVQFSSVQFSSVQTFTDLYHAMPVHTKINISASRERPAYRARRTRRAAPKYHTTTYVTVPSTRSWAQHVLMPRFEFCFFLNENLHALQCRHAQVYVRARTEHKHVTAATQKTGRCCTQLGGMVAWCLTLKKALQANNDIYESISTNHPRWRTNHIQSQEQPRPSVVAPVHETQ